MSHAHSRPSKSANPASRNLRIASAIAIGLSAGLILRLLQLNLAPWIAGANYLLGTPPVIGTGWAGFASGGLAWVVQNCNAITGSLVWAGAQLCQLTPLLLLSNRDGIRHSLESIRANQEIIEVDEDDHKVVKQFKEAFNNFVIRLFEDTHKARHVAYAVELFATFWYYPVTGGAGAVEPVKLAVNVISVFAFEGIAYLVLWVLNFRRYLIA